MKKFTCERWILKNFIAFTISYSLYSLIAHGFTGGHDYELNLMKLFAHTIALSLVGLIIGYFQHSQLSEFYSIKRTNILLVPFFLLSLFGQDIIYLDHL